MYLAYHIHKVSYLVSNVNTFAQNVHKLQQNTGTGKDTLRAKLTYKNT